MGRLHDLSEQSDNLARLHGGRKPPPKRNKFAETAVEILKLLWELRAMIVLIVAIGLFILIVVVWTIIPAVALLSGSAAPPTNLAAQQAPAAGTATVTFDAATEGEVRDVIVYTLLIEHAMQMCANSWAQFGGAAAKAKAARATTWQTAEAKGLLTPTVRAEVDAASRSLEILRGQSTPGTRGAFEECTIQAFAYR